MDSVLAAGEWLFNGSGCLRLLFDVINYACVSLDFSEVLLAAGTGSTRDPTRSSEGVANSQCSVPWVFLSSQNNICLVRFTVLHGKVNHFIFPCLLGRKIHFFIYLHIKWHSDINKKRKRVCLLAI